MTNLLFAVITSLSCLLMSVKVFHFVQLLRAPYLLDWTLPNHESLNKANKIFQMYSVEFFFKTLRLLFCHVVTH